MTDDALGGLIGTLGSIDHDEIEWASVRSATYLVHQRYRYDYPEPIHALRHRLMVVPPDFHDDQRLVAHKIRVGGCNVDIERSYDTFGNVILDFGLERVEQFVEFTAWIVAEREAPAHAGTEVVDLLAPDHRLATASRLTEPDDALAAVAQDLRATGAGGVELAELICRRVFGHFDYRTGVTTVQATAAEAWAGGVGVCQDYAHAMLALCRLCGLPARYVSGQLLGEGGSHAWVEVLVPHPRDDEAMRAVAFDPTHDRRPDLKYLTVAVGRDYMDVAPTSGTYAGRGAGVLTTEKRVAVTGVQYLRPPRRRRPGQVPTR